MKTFYKLTEDITNSTALLPAGDPPVRRRPRRQKFAGAPIFDVSPDTFFKARLGHQRYQRYSKVLGANDGDLVKFAKRNTKKPIVIRQKGSAAMMYLRRGR